MKRLAFKPGVNVESSASASPGEWNTSSLIRFRSGFVESLLGWARVCATAVTGVCRALHYWADLTGISRIAVGTTQFLYVLRSGVLTDITPLAGFTPGAASSGSIPYSLLIWSLDNFGQNLIACPSGQGIFAWLPGDPVAIEIAAAPDINQGALVLDQIQIVMAYGCSPLLGGAGDPMLVRWCEQSNYDDWIASTTNQAGSYRLPHGSRIVGGIQSPGMALLWTDVGLWLVEYAGFPYVFSFAPAGGNCGLISQKAIAVMGGIIYWASEHGFFRLSSRGPEQLDCPVWDVVFKNLDLANRDKCIAGSNFHYSEFWFFYPSINGGTGEIDSYAKYNITENVWDYGPATTGSPGTPNQMARTAWTDANQPGSPISVDLSGMLVEADTGYTADGVAFAGMLIQSGYSDLEDGKKSVFVEQFIPDFLWGGTDPALDIVFYFRDFPSEDGDPTMMGPFRIRPSTQYVTLRKAKVMDIAGITVTAYPAIRAREVAIAVQGVSGWWRWGVPRIRVSAAGEMP